ncbi:peptidoglycan DD-metalloendopeptidase family protein [Dyella sp.]|uniref:peptidoglycan DD-metalloendopeptidase family protein n=1 Tax=Dyella sp. TaxID=1869338 RepID=UPI002ED32163
MLATMNPSIRLVALSALTLSLAACDTMTHSVRIEPASPSSAAMRPSDVAPARIPGGSYQVVHGDTLYSIAFRNKVDVRDLAQWNGIQAPYTIWPGQVLRLSPQGSGIPQHAVVASAPGSAPAAPQAPPPRPAAVTPPPAAPMFEDVGSDSGKPAPAASVASASPPAKLSGTSVPAVPTSTVVPVAGAPTQSPATQPPPPPPAAVAPSPGGTRSQGGVSWRWPADGQLGKRFQSGDAIPGIEILGKAGDPVRAAADGVVVYSGNGLVGYGELIIIKHNDSFLSAYGHNRKRLVKEGQKVTAGQQVAEMGATGASRDELQFQIRKDGNPVDPLGYLPSK